MGGNTPRIATAFQPPPAFSGERQLHLSLRTIHPADEHLLLGGALEHGWQTLTGAPPAGWASAEPVNVPWSPRQLTELARTRARQSMPTWLVVVGAPDRTAIATLRVVRTRLGVEEHISMALGYPTGETIPADSLPEVAETLAADHNLATMITELRTARADLTMPAHHEPPPIPLSLTLGADAVADLGPDHARNALPDAAPLQLGPAARPALHYPLGTGDDPAAWQRLRELDDRLKSRSAKSDGTPFQRRGCRSPDVTWPSPSSRPRRVRQRKRKRKTHARQFLGSHPKPTSRRRIARRCRAAHQRGRAAHFAEAVRAHEARAR